MQLSEHFSLEELTHTDHREFDNMPTDKELANLVRLANFLEVVKAVLGGKPIVINSAFRSAQVNAAVGSKDTSQHRTGCAADIRVPGMTPDEVMKSIRAADIEFDQAIREFDRWTHISIPAEGVAPRKTALIIDKTGTRPYA
jgi:putative chitinase